MTVAAPDTLSTETRAALAAPGKLLIGGDWVDAEGGTFATHDPATGGVLAEVARGGRGEVDAAVGAAKEALGRADWAGMTPADRGAVLWRIADLIEAEADVLSEIEVLDQGKTYATARRGELPGAIAQFRYYAGFATKIHGTTIRPSIAYQPQGRQVRAHTLREPIGVVAAIVPWNSPLLMAAMKLAPALAAGCTLVLKPAEQTPLTALMLGRLLERAGLPPGVVNIVTGFGHEAGAALAAHEDVAKVAFTGSTATGRALLDAARGNLKKLTLELGGKSPALVLADADLDLAVPGLMRGIFANSGQVCVAGARVYVDRKIAGAFTDRLAAEADRLRLGHGLDPASDLGPLIGPDHAAKVAAYVEAGKRAGAEAVAGGRLAGEGPAFYRPTVLTGVRPEMALMREEIFGPVTAVTPFDDIDEALALANDTEYGLATSVWTESLSAATRASESLRAGTVWVNCHSYFSPELPKGGHGISGWGYENGAPGLENYLETKTVCLSV
ncbi:MAG: aldehyde dehydrogenase family protein [Paracoccaceae bacterium]|nr:aldehyde dehydrogenase family protein [Paracoccaceae bacterium]